MGRLESQENQSLGPKAICREPVRANVAEEARRQTAGGIPSCFREVSLSSMKAFNHFDEAHSHHGKYST